MQRGKSKICSSPEKRHKKIRIEMSSLVFSCRFSLTPSINSVSWFHIFKQALCHHTSHISHWKYVDFRTQNIFWLWALPENKNTGGELEEKPVIF
jgi:hypothetical protein